MSEYESHKGKLKKVDFEDISLAKKCKSILELEEVKVPEYYNLEKEEDCIECIQDNLDEEYVIYNNDIFKVVEKSYVDPDNDIFEAEQNENGEIEFFVKYYNGGCGFSEAIETALSKIN